MDPSEHGDGSAPYANLIERAVLYIQERGGSVAEDVLIGYVFGVSGAPKLWQPLLRQILATDHRLLLRPDEHWSLASLKPETTGSPLADFVAIDVETTGLQPRTQRIIELSLVRFGGGEVTDRFTSLLNPDRRIPKFITKLTSITDEQVQEAPHFADICASVEEFLEGALLVGHNVGFDINFINAELGRLSRPSLINDRLDTMGLAIRLVPGLRRPSLDRIATQLGFSPRTIHRAEVDAELTGNVALHLAARARDMGIDTLERLRGIGRPGPHGPSTPVNRGTSRIDRSVLATIPKKPGVYLMHDVNDRIIYIGKAKNLRDRVGSYFSQPLGYTRKMDGLLESVARIETEVTGSELTALLLESQLIRRYQPRYNVVMRSSEEYPFIRMDLANPWPRVTIAKARKDDGAHYFGPFKSNKSVRMALELVSSHYPLRTCTRSFKNAKSYGSPCIKLDIGACMGPCTGRADRDEYMQHARDVVSFFEGDDDLMLRRMHDQLEQSAESLDYERARKLRNSINLLQNLVSANMGLRKAETETTVLLVQPGVAPDSFEIMLVIAGRIWATVVTNSDADARLLAIDLARAWGRFISVGHRPIDHQTLDDVTILCRWLNRAAGAPCIVPLPVEGPSDWLPYATRAVSVIRMVDGDRSRFDAPIEVESVDTEPEVDDTMLSASISPENDPTADSP